MKERIVSGIRPTGRLHWGHYFGVIKNWIELQESYDCYYFIADWHALTSEYADTSNIPHFSREIAAELISCGLDPKKCILFIQSHVLAHAELHLLLSMITPRAWLERVPSYKDMQQQLAGKDLNTYGFLGYPLLQAADVLIYQAKKVPVGEDQVAHIEFAREVVRRFHFLSGKEIFPEPKPILTKAPRVPGIDGRKMSKSFGNAIYLSDTPEVMKIKLSQAITDPARKRREDPGHPEVCNIFAYHKLFATEEDVQKIDGECRRAAIGCVECKKRCYENAIKFWKPIQDRLSSIKEEEIEKILADGAKVAGEEALGVLEKAKRAYHVGELK